MILKKKLEKPIDFCGGGSRIGLIKVIHKINKEYKMKVYVRICDQDGTDRVVLSCNKTNIER